MALRVRRVYEPPKETDGVRVLVDRLWPRGLSKEHAAVADWLRALTPSGVLRTWYHAHPGNFAEFADLYRAELDGSSAAAAAASRLCAQAAQETVTLLTAVRDISRSHVPVLRSYLENSEGWDSREHASAN